MLIRHARVWAMACALGYSLSAAAQTASSGSALPDRLSGTTASTATTRDSYPIRTLFQKHVEEVDWNEITFEEVVEWLQAEGEGKVNVIPRWDRLSAEGADRDRLVTLKLRNVRVKNVLDEVLNQLNEDGEVTYQGKGNILRLSTRTDFSRQLIVRTYLITDLTFNIPDLGRNAPTVDLEAASRQSSGGGGGGGGGGQSIFSGSSGSGSDDLEDEEQEAEERLEELAQLIRDTVEPLSWEDGNAGGRGRIRVYGNRVLVVRNTAAVHEKIAGFFVDDR